MFKKKTIVIIEVFPLIADPPPANSTAGSPRKKFIFCQYSVFTQSSKTTVTFEPMMHTGKFANHKKIGSLLGASISKQSVSL